MVSKSLSSSLFLAVMYGKLPKRGLISQTWCISAWENSDVISLLVFSYRFSSSRSGRIYLHSDIRMIIFRKSDMDTATAHGMDMAYELRSFTHGPTNPKFSPYKWPFDHMTVLFTGMPVTELVILLVTISLCCLFIYWTSKSISSPVRSDHHIACLFTGIPVSGLVIPELLPCKWLAMLPGMPVMGPVSCTIIC